MTEQPLSEWIRATKGGVIGKPLLDTWADRAAELEAELAKWKAAFLEKETAWCEKTMKELTNAAELEAEVAEYAAALHKACLEQANALFSEDYDPEGNKAWAAETAGNWLKLVRAEAEGSSDEETH